MTIQLDYLDLLYKIKFEAEKDLEELEKNKKEQILEGKSANMVIAIQNALEDSFQKKISLADNLIKMYINYHR